MSAPLTPCLILLVWGVRGTGVTGGNGLNAPHTAARMVLGPHPEQDTGIKVSLLTFTSNSLRKQGLVISLSPVRMGHLENSS